MGVRLHGETEPGVSRSDIQGTSIWVRGNSQLEVRRSMPAVREKAKRSGVAGAERGKDAGDQADQAGSRGSLGGFWLYSEWNGDREIPENGRSQC